MKAPGLTSSPIPSIACTCKIRLFRDEESLTVAFHKHVTGQWLLDYVCSELNLVEKYYFGLRYTDRHTRRRWLDLKKPVLKQVKDPVRDSIYFRVRYYPSAPELIHEEITSYQLYMQLRRDAYHGRLVPRPNEVPILSALIIQSELGDYEDLETDDGFTKDIDLMLKQAASVEAKVVESWKELSGLTPHECEAKFIEKVKGLETYGIDPLVVKDKTGGDTLHIGANHSGIAVFQAFRRIKLIKWDSLVKCNVDGKYVSITWHSEQYGKLEKETRRYKCSDESIAKHLWSIILDQQAFFTLQSSDQVKKVKSGGLFRGSSFRFSGRCYDEVINSSHKILRMGPDFVRASSTSLNHSQNIRASRRRLTPYNNRHSIGAIPHCKSRTSTGDTETDASDSILTKSERGASDQTLSPPQETTERSFQLPPFLMIPPPTSPPDDLPDESLYSHPSSFSHDILVSPVSLDSTDVQRYSNRTSGREGSRTSSVDEFEDSVDHEHLSTTTDYHSTAATLPRYSSTPMGNKDQSARSANHISEKESFTTVTQSVETRLSQNPPIIVTSCDDSSGSDSAEDAKDDGKEADTFCDSASTQGQGDNDETQANGDVPHRHTNKVYEEDTSSDFLEGLSLPGYVVGMTVPPLVDCEPDFTYDPLSESTKGELRLYLDQLEETESELESSVSAANSERPSPLSTPRSLTKSILVLLVLTLAALLLLAYVVFESELAQNQLADLRQSELIMHAKEVYYKPLRSKFYSILVNKFENRTS